MKHYFLFILTFALAVSCSEGQFEASKPVAARDGTVTDTNPDGSVWQNPDGTPFLDVDGNPIQSSFDPTQTTGQYFDPTQTTTNPVPGSTIDPSTGSTIGTQTGTPDPQVGSQIGSQGGTVEQFSLSINVPANISSVSVSGAQACTSSCTRTFAKGTQVNLTASIRAHGKDYINNVISGWNGGCSVSGTSKEKCSINLNANKNVSLTMYEESRVGWSTKYGTVAAGVLRNAPLQYASGILTSPGLPNQCLFYYQGLCATTANYRDTAETRNYICSVLHPSSYVSDYKVASTNVAGWKNYPVKNNLLVHSRIGNSWVTVCNGGDVCADGKYNYINSLTCRRNI